MKSCICHSAARLMFPAFDAQDRHDLLMCCTCWPFGDCETVIPQLRNMADQTNGTLASAMAYADKIMQEAMEGTEVENAL